MSNKLIQVILILIIIGLNLFLYTSIDISYGCLINWKFNIALSLASGGYMYFISKECFKNLNLKKIYEKIYSITPLGRQPIISK